LKLFEIFISLTSLYAVAREICLCGIKLAASSDWICRTILPFDPHF